MNDFPFPQTLGKTRAINTVAPDPNTGKIARPTQYEPQSLLSQVGNYVNNYLGNVTTANAVKDQESMVKAGKVGNIPTGFQAFGEAFTSSAGRIKTIADEFFEQGGYTVTRTDPAAKVPGRPVAPATTHYQYPNKIDQDAKNVLKAGKEIVEQVKGLFNIGYETPIPQKAVAGSGVGSIGAAGGWALLAVIAYLLWVA